jgi:fucose permease
VLRCTQEINKYIKNIPGENRMETINSAGLDEARLLRLANLSIFTIGLGFAVRAAIADDLRLHIFNAIDEANSATLVGQALGATFLGFALTLLIGSALLDVFGIRKMLMASAVCNLGGSLTVLLASLLPVAQLNYHLVLVGLLATGLGWGMVEASINPMVVSMGNANKSVRLNAVHAWWPAGIVVGGLMGAGLKWAELAWQWNLISLCLPAFWILYQSWRLCFPKTERVNQGVSYADMCRELYRKPQFLIFWCCMWLTASAELAPGQWVDLTLSNTVGMSGLFILVYVSVLMFTLRHFASSFAHRISSMALLIFSSILASIGLYGLSLASGPFSALVFATIWGAGVCFMWPTMLANVAERFPRGGALFLGLMGFGGGLAIEVLLPKLGSIFDQAKIAAAGGKEQLSLVSSQQLNEINKLASQESFQVIAYIPLILIPLFLAIWLFDKYQSRDRH